MASDDIPLTDLAVIQRFSLAVRSAAAPRAEVIAALEADLAFLTRGARRRPASTAGPAEPDQDQDGPSQPGPARSDAAATSRVRRPAGPRPAAKGAPRASVSAPVDSPALPARATKVVRPPHA